MSSNEGPLSGITVVALEQAVAAPICTRTLGDLGARIIKVENPNGGDFTRYFDDVVNGLAAHFVWVNRGKESVTLDLKSDAGMRALHTLLDHADVLVSNLTPGATAKMGLSPDDLATSHPDLIAVEIDGYGPGGPLSHKRAYDLLIQAESGACSITGHPGMPAKPGPPMADVTTGLYAAISILSTLLGRERGHRIGSSIGVSLFDTMTELMGYSLNFTRHSGLEPDPVGMGSPAVAPYGAYRTGDGHTVVLGTTNDREWQRLARDLIGRPDLADDERFRRTPGRVAHRELLDAAIGAWVGGLDLETVQREADAAGIGNSKYNTPAEVVEHPQLKARDRWRQIDTPNGPVPALLPPPVIAGFDPPMGAIPALGEHTESVLTSLGVAGEEIAALRSQGAFGATQSKEEKPHA